MAKRLNLPDMNGVQYFEVPEGEFYEDRVPEGYMVTRIGLVDESGMYKVFIVPYTANN